MSPFEIPEIFGGVKHCV